jgi:diguanylate cyclase (GGDEF)-like protein
LKEKLEYKITHDTLTNVYNREYFEQQIEKYDKNIDVEIAIVVCDLDELKYINDYYGHKIGDELIKETAKLLKGISSNEAIVSRIGGDEFAILMLNSDHSKIELFMDKIQKEIELFNNNNSDLFKIKISKGYDFSSSSIGKMDQLFMEADKNMYIEKNEKRTNRCVGSGLHKEFTAIN